MKILAHTHPERPGLFSATRAKLLWCVRFHQKWRRRVAILPVQASGLGYEVRCLKCGMRDTEIAEFQKTKASA